MTHQVNIQALAGVFTESNRAIIVALPLTEAPDVLLSASPADRVKWAQCELSEVYYSICF